MMKIKDISLVKGFTQNGIELFVDCFDLKIKLADNI